ncbi:MAG: LPS export ABC transporter ATP-binding protein [Candidatus Coatesbacteria bacterium]
MSAQPGAVLEAVKLVKRYGGRSVVQGISMRVRQGEVVGLLGPNGAGKTTTFYMIVGLVRPDGGQVLLCEGAKRDEISRLPMHIRARLGIGYLPQEPSVFRKLTVEENLRALLETLPIPAEEQEARLKALVREFSLKALARQQAFKLSGGERRRVEIARALTTRPKFLLLDEPFAGIDPITIEELHRHIRGLKRRGLGVLITDHNVRETLAITDRAYLIHDGKVLFAGTDRELARDSRARKYYLGERFTLK